ncbi:MAG: hypothetical protein VX705_08940, partial [Verrucomicrobiota bacterium]|nr:hypothetical protein [Verrucomicrobiota bacterium]
KGLLFVGIFAAAMSSVSSALSALSSVSVMDMGLAKKNATDRQQLSLSRRATFFWAAMLIAVAYASREVESVMNTAFTLAGLTSGALLGGVLLALVLKKAKSHPIIIGMATSLAAMLAIKYGLKEAIHWPWYTAIGCGITLVTAMLATLALPRKS